MFEDSYYTVHSTLVDNLRYIDVYMMIVVLYVTECESPAISPSEPCVTVGQNFECTGTSGQPAPPSYRLYYWPESGTTHIENDNDYAVGDKGNFSLGCVANYSHQYCPENWAACSVNYTGRTFGE